MKNKNNKEARQDKKQSVNLTLPFHPDRKVTVNFKGGNISSDAGLLPFYILDQQEGFSESLAACIDDTRDQRYIQHELKEIVCQRTHQIIAGYEDCNDGDSLRSDPVLKTICNRLPESDPDLASQPTLSRLENSVNRKDLYRLSQKLLKKYVKKAKKSKRKRIVLDLDSTDDPTHGHQQLSFFHGYFKSYIYHPLLIFDADTADLICAVLRPGNKGAAAGVIAILKRIVWEIRKSLGSKVVIEIRADSGFATPALYEFCEKEHLEYEIGFVRNSRLEAEVEALVQQAREQFEKNQQKQRCFTHFNYKANSWDRSRRVIGKVEVNEMGLNRRFVVTNREDLSAQQLYDHYSDRGQTENFIKVLKNDLATDRLSCHRFWANQFRLLIHAFAYQMFLRLRDYLKGTPWQDLQIETLRCRLLKVGARIRESCRRIWIEMSSSYPDQDLFLRLMKNLLAET